MGALQNAKQPVIPSQYRNTGVGIRIPLLMKRIATPACGLVRNQHV
jgi:hypothetical protein